MNKIRLFLSSVIFSVLTISTSLHAGISPLAFNGIFKCFKPGYEMYAPNLGCAALQTGLVNNIRFCMVNPGKKDAHGNRLWIEDKAPASNPVAALAILLFPSPAGNLTAMTSHKTNLGKDLNVIHIAQLLNFCAHVRALIHNIGSNKFGASGSKCLNLLASLAQPAHKPYFKNFLANTFNFKKNDPTISQANMLISALCKIIELEEKPDRLAFENIYPKFQAEQLLNAFFCLKFGTQDIPTLLAHLDDSIVYRDVVNELTTIPLIEKSYIEQAAQKNIEQLTLDDLWVLQNEGLIDQIIPYPRNSTPVNNGLAYAYNRIQDQLITTVNFPDCAETVIRHICNLIFYSKDFHGFDLSFLKNRLKESPYLKNLEGFYAFQTPDKANSGDVSVRNAWSKVVGGLGNPISYMKKSVASIAKNDAEISSGIINTMRVLNIILDLQLDPEPVYQNSQQFAQEATAWAQASLEKMFQLICPSKEIMIDITAVEAFKTFDNQEYDCLGKINMQINNDFRCCITVKNGHTQFDYIEILTQENKAISTELIEVINQKFNLVFQNNIGESLFLLNSKTKSQVKNQFLKVFENGTSDSTKITQTLEQLLTMTQKNTITASATKIILRNLLQMVLWQDQEMARMVQPILKKWKDFAVTSQETDLINILRSESKSIQYDVFITDFDNNADSLLDFFNQASEIFYKKSPLEDEEYIVNAINQLPQNALDQLENATQTQILEYLISNFKHTDIFTFSLTRDHESLRKIDFSNTGITHLQIDQNTLPHLEFINLSETDSLRKVNLNGTFQNLKKLDLSYSRIPQLDLFNQCCPAIEELNLQSTESLKNLNLHGTFEKITTINLMLSSINYLKLSGDTCPMLEMINLISTNELEYLELNGTFKRLKKINLTLSKIKNLKNFGEFSDLNSIELEFTSCLTQASLCGNFDSLSEIKLTRSALTELQIDGCCPNLKTKNSAIKFITHSSIGKKRNPQDGKAPIPKKSCSQDLRENNS